MYVAGCHVDNRHVCYRLSRRQQIYQCTHCNIHKTRVNAHCNCNIHTGCMNGRIKTACLYRWTQTCGRAARAYSVRYLRTHAERLYFTCLGMSRHVRMSLLDARVYQDTHDKTLSLQHTATHWQNTATHCITLQHTATRYNTLQCGSASGLGKSRDCKLSTLVHLLSAAGGGGSERC